MPVAAVIRRAVPTILRRHPAVVLLMAVTAVSATLLPAAEAPPAVPVAAPLPPAIAAEIAITDDMDVSDKTV